jgi:hypothetical protein
MTEQDIEATIGKYIAEMLDRDTLDCWRLAMKMRMLQSSGISSKAKTLTKRVSEVSILVTKVGLG